MIRAITFDFWRTLFRDANSEPRQQIRIQAFAEATGVPEHEVAATLKTVWNEFARHHIEEQRTLEPHHAVSLAADALNVTLDHAAAERLAHVFGNAILEYSPELIDGAFDAVRAAAKLCPIGLISDTGVSPGAALKVLLDRHALTPYFETLTFSDEVGVSKPNALMFERTAAHLGVPLPAVLHIGDIEVTDIAGIQALDGQAALFAGDNREWRASTCADFVFDSWGDFLDLLPALVSQA